MRKLIAAANMTLDGFCDHTAIIPDEEIQEHYSEFSGLEHSIWSIRKLILVQLFVTF